MATLQDRIDAVINFAQSNGLCTQRAILFDVSRSSHRRRLWVVDLRAREVLLHCLAASGRGRTLWTRLFPRTGDTPDSWLTPEGFCMVAEQYEGEFGEAYRLDGLEQTNANVRSRAIVLHSSKSMSSGRFSFLPLWCSRGCVVISPADFERMAQIINGQTDVLLWIYSH